MRPDFFYPYGYDPRNVMIPQPVAQPVYPPSVPSMPPAQPPESICPPYMQTPMMPEMGEMEEDMDMYGYPESATTSDPPPIITNPTPIPGTFLLKELAGYPNYGAVSGNADILYTGTRGAWTFILPTWLPAPSRLFGQLLITASLDDHADVPVEDYSMTVRINGVIVREGPIALTHGTPPGGRFVNWRVLTYNVPNLRRNNRIVIENTSDAGPNDWIAFDWMELRLFYR